MIDQKEVRKVINKHDPLALIAWGASADEYDGELPEIVDAMETAKTVKELRFRIATIFFNWTGMKALPGAFMVLAQELWRMK